MVIFKPAMPGGFEAVPFDLWFDHRVHFNSKSDMDFFEFVFDSSLPDSVGCDHRVHSVVAIERLRMRDLLEDSGFAAAVLLLLELARRRSLRFDKQPPLARN